MIHRNIFQLFTTLLTCASLHASGDFIRQTDISTGIVRDSPIAGPDGLGTTNGSHLAVLPVGPDGARFDLFGIKDGVAVSTAHTVSGIHIPSATIEIKSSDPYSLATRTRADVPYEAKLTFSDILEKDDYTDEEYDSLPLSSKFLYFERLVAEYPEGENTPTESFDPDENLRIVEAFFVQANGSMPSEPADWRSLETSLQSEYAHKQKGEERIRVYALPNEDLPWHILAEKKIYIWPISNAEIKVSTTGSIDDAFTLEAPGESGYPRAFSTAPALFITADDLYPSSKTTVRIYKGEKNDAIQTTEDLLSVNAAEYDVNAVHTAVPQSIDTVIPASKINEFITEDGLYTAEIISQTPFEAFYRYTWATFEIKTGVKVRASIGTAE